MNNKFKLDILKTVQPFYNDLRKGLKTFEVRYNDRNFKVGQYIACVLYDNNQFGDEAVLMRVGYILDNEKYCLKNHVILSGFYDTRNLLLPSGCYDWQHYILEHVLIDYEKGKL